MLIVPEEVSLQKALCVYNHIYYYIMQAARVSNTLGLQNRCSSILALLANSAIAQPPNGKILSTHALSLDILISGK